MILRVAAALSVVLGATILAFYLTLVGKAPWSEPEERHLRAMKDRAGEPRGYAATTFEALAALPRRAPRGEYAAIERRAVSLEGYVQRMERAPDGDIHLDFAPALDPAGRLRPYVSAEITPQWHLGSSRWRYERLVWLFRPRFGGREPWDAPPRRVRLSGWLLYDYVFEGAPEVPGFPPHIAVWEIHPVTRIEGWDDSLGRFTEFAR